MANVVIAGEVCTIDDPEAQGASDEVTRHKLALVIEFDSPEEIREAMSKGECKFTVFERNKNG